jgi:tetratricopeptide (TPR) repeat protein
MTRIATRLLFAGLLALSVSASPLLAQDQPAKKEISEKTGTSLGQLRPLIDAKNYDAALALIQPLIVAAAPDSYDLYVLSQIKAQILLTQGKLIDAIAPLETALRLADGNPAFFDASANLDQLNLLAQLHYQRAAEAKGAAAQKAGYETSLGYITRWIERSPKPTAEVRTFTASLLYQLGTLDPAKPDPTRIREAITQGREAMLLTLAPSNQLVLLLAACHLQLGENLRAAELLETLAVRDPKSATTWSQLQSIYLSAAADTKKPDEARSLNLRALHTIERAQANGHLSTPRDNYTRVAILFNIQQFARAAALLEKGLADGSIEGVKRNWELLASAYQQIDKNQKALEALANATAKFPDDGALEFSLAQFLYNTGNPADAYVRGQSALAKGVEKRGQTEVYLAYLAYELQRYEEALKWVDAARASGDVPATTLDPLATAIADALRNREAAART